MGGGDLNTKKSWHPKNFSNQERVWKAEQKEAAEKKRLAELQREIQDERDREDLKNIARSSGFLDDGDSTNKKLEWMYKGQQLNREEYLMGRTIDKNFEKLDQEEKVKADPINPAISQPINHVEHEVIPFSIRKYKGLPGTEQVDMARKMMEDPLMLIKQKEMETRRQILQNPVKLKELHKMLKEERGKKKSKKEKKSKKKRKRKSDSDDSDVDLDKALAEKYKRLQGALSKDVDSDEDVNNAGNVDKLLSRKFEVLSKELDKMTGSKKKKKKSKRDTSSSSDDFKVSKKMESRKRSRSKSVQRYNDRDRRDNRTADFNRRSPPRRDYRRNESYRDNRSNVSYNRRSSIDRRARRSRSRNEDRKRERRSKTPVKRNKSPPERREQRKKSPSVSNSLSDSNSERQNDDSDDGRPLKKTFGLVTSDGKGISISKKTPVLHKRKSSSPKRSSKTLSSLKPEQKKPAKLTQEEIDTRLREMTANASWREKERSEKVQKYRENEKREQEEAKTDFDKDFLTKQLKKTANSTTSVESRIKSNLNNIQRSSRTMESNFARR